MFKILSILLFVFALIPQPVMAQSEFSSPRFVSEGVVTKVDTSTDSSFGFERTVQDISVKVQEEGEEREVNVEIGDTNVDQIQYREGDRVMVSKIAASGSEPIYFITGFARQTPMALLALIFVAVTITVARKKGFFSLIGLVISFAVIFGFILPNIAGGSEPLVISISGAVVIALINFYLAHGFHKQTSLAVVSTVITIIITAVLAIVFVELTRLTGFSSDEALFLTASSGGSISIREILLAGIIIGVVGILDDITISQTSVVYQLRKANMKLTAQELFTSSMEVGRDHIASLVNTLILVYTSAALPLLLLLSYGNAEFLQTINSEIFAEEIVRTLVTSIGLVAAVPISTYIAVRFAVKDQNIEEMHDGHEHHHH